MAEENKMQEIKIEKVVLNIGGTAENLDMGIKLLERISGRKASKKKSTKRIPSLGVRPGLEVGCLVTLRGEEAVEILKRLLAAISNIIKRGQISKNSFSFGIKEYIEIPGMHYQRDIGIMGLDVSVSFARPGKRTARKKIKAGRIPEKQHVSQQEIIKYMEDNFHTIIK